MDNFRGAVLMTSAMLGFAIEDMFIKLMSGALPISQILMILGLGGSIIFAINMRLRGEPLLSKGLLTRSVLLRNFGEVLGTLGFVSAIVLTPISSASAILQATPLVVTLGAALFLNEPVGWRRWTAILVGFLGVLLIIRPGTGDFSLLSLLAVQGVIGLAIRDLATRRIPKETSSMQLSLLAFALLFPTGFILMLVTSQTMVMPTPYIWSLIAAALIIGVFAYYGIVAAMRIGEISFVTPFRYSRLIFAMIVGVFVFNETPDRLMLIGSAIIVGSGIYTVWRERKQKAQGVFVTPPKG